MNQLISINSSINQLTIINQIDTITIPNNNYTENIIIHFNGRRAPLLPLIWSHLSASHAMKKILLWSNTRQEPSVHKSSRPGARVVGQEGWQKPPTQHHWRTLTLQLDLAQETRDLHTIDLKRNEQNAA